MDTPHTTSILDPGAASQENLDFTAPCAECGSEVLYWKNFGTPSAHPVCSRDSEHDAAGRFMRPGRF